MTELDIIIPAHNEEESISELGERLIKTLRIAGIEYSLIFVDDNSSDNTVNEVAKLADKYSSSEVVYSQNPDVTNSKGSEVEILISSPKIKLVKKIGPNGKATAILQGTRVGNAPFIAMIDADLQYPPEAIPALLEKAKKSGMAVAERKIQKTSFLRNVGTNINKLVFEKLLLGLNCDAQSGLKVFKRDIVDNLDTTQITPWTLDMPLLLTTLDMGYSIEKEEIEFAERKSGKSKVNFLKTGFEIARSALKLKFRGKKAIAIEPEEKGTLIGTGVSYKGKKYITHTRLSKDITAINTFTSWQELFAAFTIFILLMGLIVNARMTGIIIVSLLSLAYFVDLIFSAFLINRSLNKNPEIKVDNKKIESLKDEDLPIYSILCPLYKEANVLPRFIDSIGKLNWPKDKLDVLLLLEEDDKATINAAKNLNLPKYIRILVVPHSYPKTKPKACNFGLAYVKGQFTVVYDAEDRPDPMQLKKAYISFGRINSKVVCLQCKLNYYNPKQNLLTKLFTAEYSLWFNLILPGLQSISTTIPLGGTSNHFRTSALKYLDGWDPFNVTEDADLGTRLFKKSFQTAVVDSVTYEEANSKLKSWIKQRSRWIKGYLQTYLVHMRDPIGFYKKYGKHALIFQLVTGLRMVFTLVNPVLWLITISYFVLRPFVGEIIESLYPPAVYYIASVTLVFGNFFYLYIYMIALAKTKKWDLIKYVFFVPFYWLSASIAAAVAFYQLITNPFYWEKTAHGLHPGADSQEIQKPGQNIPEEKPIHSPRPSSVPNISFNFNFAFLALIYQKVVLILNFSFSGSSVLILATILASGTNFLFNAYFGRLLKVEDFGTVNLISNIYTFASVLTSSLALTISYKSAYLFGKYKTTFIRFWKKIRQKVIIGSSVIALSWLLASPGLKMFFNTDNSLPYLLFTPFWIISFVGAVDSGFLTGSLRFKTVAAIIALSPIIKLISAYFFVRANYINGIYLAIPLSTVIPFILGWVAIVKNTKSKNQKIRTSQLSFPFGFFTTSVLLNLSQVIFLSLDIVLAKHYLSPTLAGQYALLSLSGKIVYFLGTIFSQFINPFVSYNEGKKEDSLKTFYKLFIATSLACLSGFVLIGLFGYETVPFLFGEKARQITSLLPIYTAGMVCFTLASTIITYHQVKKHYVFPIVGLIVVAVELWYIALFHQTPELIAQAVSFTGLFYFTNILFLHFSYPHLGSFIDSTVKFFTIRKSAYQGNRYAQNLRILIYNWRDTKHVWAGGAELYLQEIAKRLVRDGHEVTIFCGNDGESKSEELVDGVNIVRKGGFYLVYFWAFIYYFTKFRGKFDLIIDSENGIPFFTPLYVKEPVIGLVHHIHKDIILDSLKLPFYLIPVATVARQLETIIMPLVYSRTQMITVSESSKSDMKLLGFGRIKPIHIITPGVNLQSFYPGAKSKKPSILYLGRIKAYKSIDTVIRAMKDIVKQNPYATLKIAGFGEETRNLENLTRKLKLQNSVEFIGKVSEDEKTSLMRKAWVFVSPSTKEGFGITSIEASASGTPVVASDVSGLRDSVKDQENGFLIQQGDESKFAEKINLLINDPKLRKEMEQKSVLWAQHFTWEKSTNILTYLIRSEIASQRELPNLLGQPAYAKL